MSRPLVLPLRGEIDIAVVNALRSGWYGLAEEGRVEEILVDLLDVTFMDAAGLGLMIGTRKRQRRHGGDLRLCNAPAHVTRLLRLTGLSPVFPDAEMRCADPGLSLVDLRDDVTLHTSL